jgi:1,4-dihydroxy-2-naphthoate octaprenyltransferase
VGYFAAVAVAEADGAHLIALMVSSALLYIAVIILNEYFDI